MTEHKFTDDEIIRALGCCRDFGDCSLCPYAGATFEDEPDCAEKMHTDALDLINRQKAEIERLKQDLHGCVREVSRSHEIDKNKAIEEFAERLKEKIRVMDRIIIYGEDIDNLVKEMTEGES